MLDRACRFFFAKTDLCTSLAWLCRLRSTLNACLLRPKRFQAALLGNEAKKQPLERERILSFVLESVINVELFSLYLDQIMLLVFKKTQKRNRWMRTLRSRRRRRALSIAFVCVALHRRRNRQQRRQRLRRQRQRQRHRWQTPNLCSSCSCCRNLSSSLRPTLTTHRITFYRFFFFFCKALSDRVRCCSSDTQDEFRLESAISRPALRLT